MEIFNFFILGTIPNPICRRHIMEVIRNTWKGKLWALQMLDSSSKIPIGIMTGNDFDFGNYEECIDVNVSGEFGNFTGKHCLVDFDFPLTEEYKKYPLVKDFAKYHWSLCVPSTCTTTDLTYLFKYGLHIPLVDITDRSCITKDIRPYTSKEFFTLFIIALLLVLMLLSTIYNNIKTSAKKNELFQAFSLTRNFKTMLETNTPPGSIDAFHGMRFCCILGVIFVHAYMGISIAANINLINFSQWISDWLHVFVTSRGVLLDAFFILGGFLVAYMYMRDRDSGKKFNLAIYILHRFLRIAPAMYMILLFTATLANRLSIAPFWRTYSVLNEKYCQESWWLHALFIQNWIPNLYCMEHTWYLSVDMQLFIISPLMLYPLYRWPRVGVGITIFTIVLSFISSFISSFLHREKVDLLRNMYRQERHLYELSYVRLGPWAIGVLCGFIAYQNRHMQKNILDAENEERNSSPAKRFKKYLISAVLLSISFVLAVAVMAAVHPFMQPDYEYKVFESSLYLASSHMMSSMAVIVMVAVMLAGYGGPVTVVLTAKPFVPLARLSYSIFLIHLIILKVWCIGTNSTNFLSDYNVFLAFFSISLYSILFSPILFLMVEQPFIEIDKIIMQKLNGSSRNFNVELKGNQSFEPSTIRPELQAVHYTNDAFELSERLNADIVQNDNTIFDLSKMLKQHRK